MSNEKKQIEEMAKVLKDYTEKNRIMASHVILECYAEEIYSKNYRKQEWISVDERLPEVGTRVVGYDYESNVRCYFITEGRWWIDEGWNTAKGWGITHWMPLPEAPKMKGGAE